eukprot:TRINITY_DN24360_c0_g1_i1.p1 TRINITY_DN24360_c0_g1~~TRINITY_DN24360_c0_g1_i1.p1  ORF type:complete len:415 (+),score=44.89 TRINITY_DN24360_c0_g1_i1:81-1247(+)
MYKSIRNQRRQVLSFYDKTVEECASKKPLHVTTEYIVDFSKKVDQRKLITLSRYLYRELPIRLARTIRDMQGLPYIVGVNPHIENIYEEYYQSFEILRQQQEPIDFEKHLKYCEVVTKRLNVHANVISNLSKGIKEVRLLPDSSRVDYTHLDKFLDKALVERVSRRVLSELLLVLNKKVTTGEENSKRFGVFTLVKPSDIIVNCMNQVGYLAEEMYGVCPDFNVTGDVDAELLCVASHLEYILFELCKNAVRAVVERHIKNPPSISLKICKGDKITIIISDRGGGMPEEAKACSYGYSTSPPTASSDEEYSVKYSASDATPPTLKFAGFGFGLPLSRVYSTYSGGSLVFNSLPGYGTDVYLSIPTASDALQQWEEGSRIGTFYGPSFS